jgi:hypothetical protein
MNLHLTPSDMALAYVLTYLPTFFVVVIFGASIVVYRRRRKLSFLFLCAGCGLQVAWSIFAGWGLLFYHVQQAHPFVIRCFVDFFPVLTLIGWILLAREKDA